MAEQVLHGIAASEGKALGIVRQLHSPLATAPHRSIAVDEIEAELARLNQAVQASSEQMHALLEDASLDGDLRGIFEAQILMFEDPMLLGETADRIRNRRINAEWALGVEIEVLRNVLLKSNNEMIRERAADIEDVGNRILANLLGVDEQELHLAALRNMAADSILAAKDVSPSLMLHLRSVAALAVEEGGVTGHTAILARSRGIPVLVQVAGLMEAARDGTPALLDAVAGRLILNPHEESIAALRQYQDAVRAQRPTRIETPTRLKDGAGINFWLNAADIDDAEADCLGAAGIGLFRTEFLYIRHPRLLHSREDQTRLYQEIYAKFQGKDITLRLIDAGVDKPLPGYKAHPDETGVRFLLDNPDILEDQIYATLHGAAAAGVRERPLRLLVPGVVRLEEMQLIRSALERARTAMAREHGSAPAALLGAMLETPAAALMADVLSQAADFFSIGANDLMRYSFALDRDSSYLGEEIFFQPALFRLIKLALDRSLRPVSICGEIAGKAEILPLLLGLGLRDFSMSENVLPDCYRAAQKLSLRRCEELAARALNARTAAECADILED